MLDRVIVEITFGKRDLSLIQNPSSDLLVISLKIINCFVKRVLIDNGSSVEVMFIGTFNKIGLAK